ncbi:MAG: orotidine-5'-phosphate decarboxylase [Acidobacteriota bacterium]
MTTAAEPSAAFADRLTLAIRRLGHPLCVGLDPHPGCLPAVFRRDLGDPLEPTDPRVADAWGAFFFALIDRLEGRVAVVKPQVAFFERLGWRGLRTLEQVVRRAHERDLMVIMDAKRGDIGSTAAAYARAFLGAEAPFPSDALTVNPYLGLDTLDPFVERAAEHGAGLFVLVRTSNPGAADLQDQQVDGEALHLRLAAALAERTARLRGSETGWSGLGAVVGATWPEDADRVRERLPDALVLVPGYGAQGGSAKDAVRAFVRGPDGRLEGGVVNSSRGIVFPAGSERADNVAAWEWAIDDAIERAVDDLGSAVA